MLFKIYEGQHILVHSEIVEGDITVVNSLLDGSTLPCRHSSGDQVDFGAAIVKGHALCKVLEDFESCIAFQLMKHALKSVPLELENFSFNLSNIASPTNGLRLLVAQLGFSKGPLPFLLNPFKDSEFSWLLCGNSAC